MDSRQSQCQPIGLGLTGVADYNKHNGVDLSTIAQLERRIVILETELRFAEAGKQGAQVALQTLLELFGSKSNAMTSVGMSATSPTADHNAVGRQASLERRYEIVKRDCDLLRRKYTKLQRRTPAVRQYTKTLQEVLFLMTRSNGSSVSTWTPESTPTVSTDQSPASSQTFLSAEQSAILPKKEFLADKVDLLSDCGSNDTVSSDHINYEPTLDDIDTYPQWHVDATQAVTEKSTIPFIHHFQNVKNDAQDVSFDSTRSQRLFATDSNTAQHGQLSHSSKEENNVVSHLRQLQPSRLREPLSASTRVKLSRQVPTDPDEDYRMVCITNLPSDITASELFLEIHGGAVVNLSFAKSGIACSSTTAHVTFFNSGSASSFATFCKKNPLIIKEQCAAVTIMKIAAVPAVLERMRKEFCTRCLRISGLPEIVTSQVVEAELIDLDYNNKAEIASIALDEDGSMLISFVSVEAAISAQESMMSSDSFKPFKINFAYDPCARPLRREPRTVTNIGPQSAKIHALSTGTYLHHAPDSVKRGRFFDKQSGGYPDEPQPVASKKAELVYDDAEDLDTTATKDGKSALTSSTSTSTDPEETVIAGLASQTADLLDNLEIPGSIVDPSSANAKVEAVYGTTQSSSAFPPREPDGGVLELVEALTSISETPLLPKRTGSSTDAHGSPRRLGTLGDSKHAPRPAPTTNGEAANTVTSSPFSAQPRSMSPPSAPRAMRLTAPGPPSFNRTFHLTPIRPRVPAQAQAASFHHRGRGLVKYDDLEYDERPAPATDKSAIASVQVVVEPGGGGIGQVSESDRVTELEEGATEKEQDRDEPNPRYEIDQKGFELEEGEIVEDGGAIEEGGLAC